MPKSPLDELKSLLRSHWMKPRYAIHALRKLEDHLADLEAAAREHNLSPADAQAVALDKTPPPAPIAFATASEGPEVGC